MSFFIFFIIYKNHAENNSQHVNNVDPNKELGHAKIFENQFYRIFDNIEEYDFSNLVKKPTYRTGLRILVIYVGVLEMVQKSSKERFSREGICMKTLRWLKIRTDQLLLIFSSKCPSRVRTLRWLTFLSSKSPRLFEPFQGPPRIIIMIHYL